MGAKDSCRNYNNVMRESPASLVLRTQFMAESRCGGTNTVSWSNALAIKFNTSLGIVW